MFGTALNDTIRGNAADNLLIGNAGDNVLVGREGRDILIRGLGPDTLNGGSGDDLLIAGRTTIDGLVPQLSDIRSAWLAVDSYSSRVSAIRNGVGTTAASLKVKVNVLNDNIAGDQLTGGTEQDWFFYKAVDDVITDLT